MPLLLSSSLILPTSNNNQINVLDSGYHKNIHSTLKYTSTHCIFTKTPCQTDKSFNINLKNKPLRRFRSIVVECTNSSFEFFDSKSGVTEEWSYQEDEDTDDIDSPWEGAVVYQRNASISHVEYCTTLERLGLGEYSTEVSKSRASLMGLRVTKAVKDYPLGTPVMVSLDITRKKQKLRLDGIIRTVLTLGCNRCGEPAAECVFSNFSLLLTEEPVEEPDILDMGVMFGDSTNKGVGEDLDDDSIDWEDRLFFPREEKTIDISKHIRDMVHLEITINSVCDPTCKGLCLDCGANLNLKNCGCSKRKAKETASGPLGGLKEKMQQS
ncbi:hypothetical protein DCAR_0935322 [Daucus carota subsp. sativus]|uniref:DUF177 domain-containing protein n=1 Tax=Daucus carota subsp. sativus TaxID=79200 RepID=A0A175YGN0_DAUCS|nr:PREDICTED: uncharacterized protein LOC108200700 [Daucus carota subsp. sativus]WOH15776.1 hypothetical protein DCAR_0935322 [Daucus carota subsp. sativus]